MDILTNCGELPDGLTSSVVTLGNFDGVHLGHRELCDQGDAHVIMLLLFGRLCY